MLCGELCILRYERITSWDELLREPADMSSVAKSGTRLGVGRDAGGLMVVELTSLYIKQNL
jgi:hypothetical protein